MATICRKRKYKEENRSFQPEWEEDLDVIKYGFQLPMNIVMEPSAAEMEMSELQEDPGLAMIHKSQSVMDLWKLVPEVKYPPLN